MPYLCPTLQRVRSLYLRPSDRRRVGRLGGFGGVASSPGGPRWPHGGLAPQRVRLSRLQPPDQERVVAPDSYRAAGGPARGRAEGKGTCQGVVRRDRTTRRRLGKRRRRIQ